MTAWGTGLQADQNTIVSEKEAKMTKFRLAIAVAALLSGLLASGATALADPTTLICNNDSRPDSGA